MAVKETESMSTLADLVDRMSAMQPPTAPVALVTNPDGGGQMALVRHGYDVKMLAGKQRGRRLHAFEALASCAEWLQRYAEPGTAEILINATGVKAVLDGKDHESDLVTCALVHHPLFLAWVGRPPAMDQKAAYAFLRTVADSFASENPGALSRGEQLTTEIRKLRVAGTSNMELDLSDTGYQKVRATGDKREVAGNIPSAIIIRVPVYEGVLDDVAGERQYDLEVLVSIDVESEFKISFSIPRLEQVKRQALRDAVEYLRQLLGEGWLVGVGALSQSAVPARS